MTVGNLIEKLSVFDPDLKVCTSSRLGSMPIEYIYLVDEYNPNFVVIECNSNKDFDKEISGSEQCQR